MKSIFYIFALILAILVGCNEAPSSAKKDPPETKMPNDTNSQEKEQKTADRQSESDCYIIDVRTKKEWDGGHLESAVNIPHTEIVEEIGKLTTDKNAKIYVY